jgi:Aspartyl protease
MAQLRYTITKGEIIVPALVGLNHTDTTTLLQAGQHVPAPIYLRALIDTGCSATAVSPIVFGQLGLVPLIAGSSQTASGSVAVNLYRVSLSVYDPNQAPLLTVRDLLVSELTIAIPAIDVLIGMDVLLTCKLLLDGPARQITLDF